MLAEVALPALSSTSNRATEAPHSASLRAAASPMPFAAPVTIATLPSKLMFIATPFAEQVSKLRALESFAPRTVSTLC